MWGSHHRKMVCHANRGDGGHEEWQDAIPPLPMDVPPRATRHAVQPVWSRISRQVDRSPSAAFFMGNKKADPRGPAFLRRAQRDLCLGRT